MEKRKQKRKTLTNEMRQQILSNVIRNTTVTRRMLLDQLLNPGKDMNYECGWPETIDIADYKRMFDREGSGYRVTTLLPFESWALPPMIYETEETEETEFEKRVKELDKKKHILSYLQKADILSGIGRFGILLIGLSDGKELNKPVEGIDPVTGEQIGKGKQYELLYLRPFDESAVEV